MLTRLRVSGFKNLINVDVRFGPFTCIAGVNGVGKSNLFDAILFLSALAEKPLVDAALSVRAESGRTADVRSLFHRVGDHYANRMSFDIEMIVPAEGQDDLGQRAEASITFLRYALTLAYRADDESTRALGSLEILKEELVHINLGDAPKHLLFPHSTSWRHSAVSGRGRRGAPFISTDTQGGTRLVRLHQEGRQGRPLSRLAARLPRTVLSVTNAAESPTVLLAQQEMRSWRLLQLEPSAMRKPDEFTAPTRLSVDGSHVAAALYSLARGRANGQAARADEAAVYARVANRLAQLIDDVQNVSVDRDEKRELLTLLVTGRDGTAHPARALSDGTLRFLALAVLEEEPQANGLLCLEEPENGIHPARIPAMLRLLQDIATDTRQSIGPDNPLRQVIVNTHSPSVVLQVPDDSLVLAEPQEVVADADRFKRVRFSGLANTWRQREDRGQAISRGNLLAYLNPELVEAPQEEPVPTGGRGRPRRVMDHPDIQPLLFPSGADG